jgi:hypothetical protein
MYDYKPRRHRLLFHRQLVPMPALIMSALLLGLFGCAPYELRQVLDGPLGKALSITPLAATVAGAGSVKFTADGGVPPYTFSLISGGGSLDPATGIYTAPGTAGAATIRVSDKTGKSVDAAVAIESYSITSVALPVGSTTGQAVSGSFTIQNMSSSAGVSPIAWEVYASFGDAVYNSGDILLASGAIGALAGLGSASQNYTGAWPSRAGTYYIVVRASSFDVPSIADTASGAVAVLRPPSPDYTVSFDNGIPWSGVVSTAASLTGTCQITITNKSATNDGHSAITWAVYLSTDKVLDENDTLLQQGVTGALGRGASTTAAFDGIWPAASSVLLYFIASVRASDDSNPMNDVVAAPHPSATGDCRYQEGAEDNSAIGPTLLPSSPASDTLATLGAGQTLVIEGVMDAYAQFDTYKLTTDASMSVVSVRAFWTTGFDDLNLFLWDTGALDYSTQDPAVDAEPTVGTYDVPGITPRICYVGAYMTLAGNTSGSTGKKYVIMVKGLP